MHNILAKTMDNIRHALKTKTGLTTFFWIVLLVFGFFTENYWYSNNLASNRRAHEKRSDISKKIALNRQLLSLLEKLERPILSAALPFWLQEKTTEVENVSASNGHPGLSESTPKKPFEEEESNFLSAEGEWNEFFKTNFKLSESPFYQKIKKETGQEVSLAGEIFRLLKIYSESQDPKVFSSTMESIKKYEAALNSTLDDVEIKLSELSEIHLEAQREDEKILEKMGELREVALFFFAVLAITVILIQLFQIGASEKLRLKFEESTKTLALLDEVKNSIAKSSSFREALVQSIEIILEKLHWEAGHAYLVKEETNKIVPSNEWCIKGGKEMEFEALKNITEKTEFIAGDGIIGRVVASRKSECIPNIKKVDWKLFHRIIEVAPHQIRGAWAFPILTEEGKVVAAFELYSFEEKRPNAETIKMMEFIGSQLGAAFKRKRIETDHENLLMELNERNAKLEANAKRLEEAKEKAEKTLLQKNKLVSLVSHDLRLPLATIISFSDIILQGPEGLQNEQQVSIVNRIKGCCEDQLCMIDQLLDVSRLQNRGFNPDYTMENARLLAINAKQHLTHLADKKGIKLVVDISKDLAIHVDQFLMEGVVKNLIANAIKFCRKGDEIRVYDLPENPVTIVVSDTGIGVDEERLKKIFDLNNKIVSTPGTSGEKGTGLGLPLCREIMEAHGGYIKANSTPGKGSKFFIHIPVSV